MREYSLIVYTLYSYAYMRSLLVEDAIKEVKLAYCLGLRSNRNFVRFLMDVPFSNDIKYFE